MHPKTIELQERTRRFATDVVTLCDRLPADPSAQKTAKKLISSSEAAVAGYTDTCASPSPEKFIAGISAVAREARRARASLQMLVQLNHVTFESARDLVLEARGLEAIFTKSRNTARRHYREKYGGITPRRRRSTSTARRRPSSSGRP